VSGGATIELRGLAVAARIGVGDEERESERPLLIDVELLLPVAEATESDRIEETVDYAAVAELAGSIATGAPHRTLERLAGKIADRLIALELVAEVEVRVAKPRPPMPAGVAEVAVRVRRVHPGQ
jgi:dihydroneopterin aldolase